jgi:hypothetical protein
MNGNHADKEQPTMTSFQPQHTSTKPSFDFKSKKAWVIFLSVVAVMAIFSNDDATKNSSSAATTTSTSSWPQNNVAANKAAAEISRVGIEQYFNRTSVAVCTTLGDLVIDNERATYIRRCVPDQIKWCREAYANRGFC